MTIAAAPGRFMSEEHPTSLWANLQIAGSLVVGAIVFWIVRAFDIFRLGKRSEADTQKAAASVRDEADHHLASVKSELSEQLERLVKSLNEERAQLRERIAILERDLETFRRQYNDQVVFVREQNVRIEANVAEIATLRAEKTGLEKRLRGAMKRLADAGIQDEQAE